MKYFITITIFLFNLTVFAGGPGSTGTGTGPKQWQLSSHGNDIFQQLRNSSIRPINGAWNPQLWNTQQELQISNPNKVFFMNQNQADWQFLIVGADRASTQAQSLRPEEMNNELWQALQKSKTTQQWESVGEKKFWNEN